uniref:Putative secreted protein n=1 Tax=Xenopsylla cheopis TaxID=163159 RepID=A0A6M2DW09_XENCH
MKNVMLLMLLAIVHLAPSAICVIEGTIIRNLQEITKILISCGIISNVLLTTDISGKPQTMIKKMKKIIKLLS